MKKLAAYMLLAALVYVLIYFVLIQGKRASAEKTSAFCQQLEETMLRADIEKQVKSGGFQSSEVRMAGTEQSVLMISHPDETQSVCKALVSNGRLIEKQFVLSVF